MSEVTFNRRGERVYFGILPPWWDSVDVTYPTNTTEVYTYSAINTDTNNQEVQAIILVTYVDSTKQDIQSVKKTYHAPKAY